MSDTQDDSTRVVQALAGVGVSVNSVYDLVNTAKPYPEAIPVLIGLLTDGIQDERVAEGVVRALGVKEARGVAARPLLEAFRRAPSDRWTNKWVIGNSLYVVADRSVVEDIMRLATDKTHGRAREMLVATLGRFKTPETTRVLIELLDDADVAAHAAKALGKQKAAEARASDEQACKAPFDEVMYALTNYLEAFAMVGGARMSLRVQPQVTPYP